MALNEKGILFFVSGIVTLTVMIVYNYTMSPACNYLNNYTVPFVILFTIIGSILLIFGIYVIFMDYSKIKPKKKRRKR